MICAFRELVQLHIDSCARRHFLSSFWCFLFFFTVTPCLCLYGARYSPRPCSIERSWHCSSSSWCRAALLSFTAFANAGRSADQGALLEISAFSLPFSSSSSSVSCPADLGFHRCPDGCCDDSLSESNLSRWRVLAFYRRVPCSARVYQWNY